MLCYQSSFPATSRISNAIRISYARSGRTRRVADSRTGTESFRLAAVDESFDPDIDEVRFAARHDGLSVAAQRGAQIARLIDPLVRRGCR